jgi:F-type H+-transporting ATPase subunit epsilon
MAKTLTLEMVTPEKVALQTDAEAVVLPAHQGEMGVLPGHEPFLVMLRPGEVRVTAPGGERRFFAIAGGFAEVQRNKVSVFAETAELAEEIDAERARQSLEKAKAAALAPGVDPMTLAQAEFAIRRAQARLRISELRVRRGSKGPQPHHAE